MSSETTNSQRLFVGPTRPTQSISPKPLRVGLLTNIPTPYRLPLFQLLNEQPQIELEVAFNAQTERNRRWSLSKEYSFSHRMLPGFTLSLGNKDLLSVHLNWTIRKWLEEGNFDVVIVGGWSSITHILTILYTCRYKLPVVIWSGSTHGEPSLLRSITLPLVRHLLNCADAYLAYGRAAKDYLVHLGAPADLIALAPNTVDVEWWRSEVAGVDRPRAREQLGLSSGFVALYVGQLIERKGVDVLIRAFRMLQRERPDAQLVIAGEGPLETKLRELGRDIGVVHVHFLGHTPYNRLPMVYSAADVVVLPSRREVWGLTLNEAMAAGRPVIASRATGASQDLIIHGQNGWITETDSPDSLAQCLRVCAALSFEDWSGVAERAQSHVIQHFSLQSTVKGFLEAIRMAQRHSCARA